MINKTLNNNEPWSVKIPGFEWENCYILNDGTVYKFNPDNTVKTYNGGVWKILEDISVKIEKRRLRFNK